MDLVRWVTSTRGPPLRVSKERTPQNSDYMNRVRPSIDGETMRKVYARMGEYVKLEV